MLKAQKSEYDESLSSSESSAYFSFSITDWKYLLYKRLNASVKKIKLENKFEIEGFNSSSRYRSYNSCNFQVSSAEKSK